MDEVDIWVGEYCVIVLKLVFNVKGVVYFVEFGLIMLIDVVYFGIWVFLIDGDEFCVKVKFYDGNFELIIVYVLFVVFVFCFIFLMIVLL